MAMKLENVFNSVAEKLAIDFKYISSQVEHRISKGHIREIELVEQFLIPYLPYGIGIGHGEIVSTDGQVSSESDIVLYDKRSCPVLIQKTGYQVFPIELVYAVIEVKSNLDSGELSDALRKVRKIKNMPKIAYRLTKSVIITTFNIYGEELKHFPTLGFVFAYDSINLITLRQQLSDAYRQLNLKERIDSVWVLAKGAVVNYSPERDLITGTPEPGTELRAMSSENPLLLMVVQLQTLMQSASVPRFQIEQYFPDTVYGRFIQDKITDHGAPSP